MGRVDLCVVWSSGEYMNRMSVFAAIAAVGVAFASPAFAVVVGGSVDSPANAGFKKLVTPFDESKPDNTVGGNHFNKNVLYAFDEDQNILLDDRLRVDYGDDIATGTMVASHYVFYDPKDTKRLKGSVEFDAKILGVASSKSFLDASDFLANNLVTYVSRGLRGLESNDHISFSDNILNVNLYAGNPGDYLRVFTERSVTAAVPIPAALPLFASALFGLGFFARRRRG